MSAGLIASLLKANLPHLIGLAMYCLIAIGFSVLCYKIFVKIIPLNISFDSTPNELIAAAILAVGSVVSISLLIALNATTPPIPPPFPRSISIQTLEGGAMPRAAGCTDCSGKNGPARKIRVKKPAEGETTNSVEPEIQPLQGKEKK